RIDTEQYLANAVRRRAEVDGDAHQRDGNRPEQRETLKPHTPDRVHGSPEAGSAAGQSVRPQVRHGRPSRASSASTRPTDPMVPGPFSPRRWMAVIGIGPTMSTRSTTSKSD